MPTLVDEAEEAEKAQMLVSMHGGGTTDGAESLFDDAELRSLYEQVVRST